MTPDQARESYKVSLKKAKVKGEGRIISDLEFRIRLMEQMKDIHIDPTKLTYRNTHGDYTINQLICGKDRINGIVDWTCACKHPVVWELVRSYFYAQPLCIEGALDFDSFKEYVTTYTKYVPLTKYDYDQLMLVYYYQIGVCDYYSQYFNADKQNQEEYLWQATFATKVLRFMSEHWDEMISISHKLT